MEQLFAKIYGEVQGVFYRAATQQRARELEILGEVKNCEDGTVEVIAEGTPEALEAFIEFLKEGPVDAEVSDIEVTWRAPSFSYHAFIISA